jgi:hypothetical protein
MRFSPLIHGKPANAAPSGGVGRRIAREEIAA